MAHVIYHARSSVKQFGGVEADYYQLHSFFDQTKAYVPSNVHRMVLHHDFGVELCQQIYGRQLRRASDGVEMLTEEIARQHVEEDFGFVPTLAECVRRYVLPEERRRVVLMEPEQQAEKLARKLGGKEEDYKEFVEWFWRPVEVLGEPVYFRFLGNSFGIFLAEARFGISVTRGSDQKVLPTRYVGEQLVQMVLQRIPTLSQFLQGIPLESWMCKGARRLSVEMEENVI